MPVAPLPPKALRPDPSPLTAEVQEHGRRDVGEQRHRPGPGVGGDRFQRRHASQRLQSVRDGTGRGRPSLRPDAVSRSTVERRADAVRLGLRPKLPDAAPAECAGASDRPRPGAEAAHGNADRGAEQLDPIDLRKRRVSDAAQRDPDRHRAKARDGLRIATQEGGRERHRHDADAARLRLRPRARGRGDAARGVPEAFRRRAQEDPGRDRGAADRASGDPRKAAALGQGAPRRDAHAEPRGRELRRLACAGRGAQGVRRSCGMLEIS